MGMKEITEEGTFYFNEFGKRHRMDGPAIEFANGSSMWYENGLQHRENGPAVELTNGSKQYYMFGKLHREDGPAVDHTDGYKEWWINGDEVDEVKFKEIINKDRTEVTLKDVFSKHFEFVV